MKSLSATDARSQLYTLLDSVSENHSPLHIKGKRSSAVLISEDDWNSIQETLYVLSIPGMRESLLRSKTIKLSDCKKDTPWSK